MTSIEGVSITPLRKIHNPKGDIFHVLKSTEDLFLGFGEAYFTTVNHGDLKGWKQHTKMVMNLVVPVGKVAFHFYNEYFSKSICINAGERDYVRLTVQPGIWMAFEGLAEGLNLVLNIASIPHDPKEAINVAIDSFPLGKMEEEQ